MKHFWEPLWTLIKSHSPLSTVNDKIYKAIYKHFQKSTEPLRISDLTERMKVKHVIPSEKTLATVNSMAYPENKERPIITINQGEITPDDNFFQRQV